MQHTPYILGFKLSARIRPPVDETNSEKHSAQFVREADHFGVHHAE